MVSTMLPAWKITSNDNENSLKFSFVFYGNKKDCLTNFLRQICFSNWAVNNVFNDCIKLYKNHKYVETLQVAAYAGELLESIVIDKPVKHNMTTSIVTNAINYNANNYDWTYNEQPLEIMSNTKEIVVFSVKGCKHLYLHIPTEYVNFLIESGKFDIDFGYEIS